EPLLDPRRPDAVLPHRQTPFEAELDEVAGTVQLERVGVLLAAEPGDGAVGARDRLGEVGEHQEPPERCRERRDQETVVAPRRGAGPRAARVAAEAVRD